jgi:hypothetical protein
MLWILVSLLGLYMMARASISWKNLDKAPHRATVEARASCTEQMLSVHFSEEHYMFLLASKLQARVSNADELHFSGQAIDTEARSTPNEDVDKQSAAQNCWKMPIWRSE